MGLLLILNFGTFTETNRFASLATSRGLLDTNLMETHPPGALVVPGGVRTIPPRGFARTESFHGLANKVWRGKLADGSVFRTKFESWMQGILGHQVECLYITGHHWMIAASDKYTTVSWTDTGTDFSARFQQKDSKLTFGSGGDRVALDTTTMRKNLKLVIGFGCNVATAINSSFYQSWSAPSKPVILAWERSIAVPSARSGVTVNGRFFDYIDALAKANSKIPATGRLAWLYDHEPMELVRAWGYATIPWLSRQARARGKHGDFYRFSLNKAKDTATPVKI